jgi:tetratricopeptide (TPR) repeat protein
MANDYFATAVQCHARGNLREAERLYRAHLDADRHHGGALQGLGIVLAQQGKLNDAVLLLQRALASRPGAFEMHSNLGVALLTLGRAEEAGGHFSKALALNPRHAEAHNGLGVAEGQLGRREQALDHLLEAVALRPDFGEAHANIGLALRELGRHDEARAACEKAIALAPDNPALFFELAKAHAELGDLAAAEAAYEKALRLAPMRTDIHRQLAQIKQYAKGDPHLDQMLALASQSERLSPQARMDLDFAIGKALIDAGDQERALVHLHKANAIVRQRIDYDEAATLGLFERVGAAFGDSPVPATGDPSPLPVFVVGMPRSGTTLTEQILASHPQVFGAGEPDYLENAAMAVAPFSGAAAMTASALRELGSSYVARLGALAPAASRIVDKMPANFRFVGLIHRALPNAKIIHMRRDPVDTCMSCFAQLFAGLPFAYDLGELGRYYRGYAALMAHWRRVLPPGAMLEVEYERLVADLPGEARRMVAYCGLDWDDACLQFHATRRAVRTASFAQVRQPVYRTSIGRWEGHRCALKPLIDALG